MKYDQSEKHTCSQQAVEALGQQPVPDENGEAQPKKRCKHDHAVVSVEDLVIPEIIHPIQD